MAVPILRDVALDRLLNDPQVLAGREPVVSCWVGRLGSPATVTWATTELLPNGGLGTSAGGSMQATASHTGHYTASLPDLTPGRYYRLTVTAADPAVPADRTVQTFQFTHTPGRLPGE